MIPRVGDAHRSTATRLLVLAVTLVGPSLLSARPAVAQTPEARWQIGGDSGFQSTTLADILTEPITFERFAETGDLTRLTEINRHPTIHVSAGVAVWRTLGLRFGFSQFTRNDDMQLSVSIPHPFFFDRHRRFSAVGSLKQRERSVDVHAQWTAHQSDRVAFSVFGGPTLYRTNMDIATLQTSEEEYPFDASPVTGIILFQRTPVSLGYGVGADLAVFFSRHVGVGWLGRYSRASATIALPDDGFFATALERTGVTTDATFGGAVVSGGLRFRF
jgi:hypothetical protein